MKHLREVGIITPTTTPEQINIMIEQAVARAKEQEANEANLRNLSTPSLEALSYALRHPETWPPGFEWNFAYCQTCAMGLAYRLWGVGSSSSSMADNFGMKTKEARKMFTDPGLDPNLLWLGKRNMHLITPDMIADRIDRYLKKHRQ